MNVVALNGSPSAPSRSHALAAHALELAGGGTLVDLADLDPAALLALGSDPGIDEVVASVAGADVLIVATPIYRATYTALTKTVFDLLPQDALRGTVVVPVASGYGAAHSLAVDHGLRPLVASVGGVTVATGVYAVRQDVSDDGVLSEALSASLAAAVAEALALAAALRPAAG